MKLFLAAGLLFGFGAVSASAADLPAWTYTKSPTAMINPAVNWSGFYVGANIGYDWGRSRNDMTTPDSVFFLGTVPGGVTSDTLRRNGATGGGQLGYNVQFDPHWVIGVEADAQFLVAKSRSNQSSPFSLPPLFVGVFPVLTNTGTISTSTESKIDWFGTMRGRLGYTWGSVLLYGTGGLAYGQVSTRGIQSVSSTPCNIFTGCAPATATTSFGSSSTRAGWTAGGGIEGKIASHWSWKVEYLHVDLGSLDDVTPLAAGGSISSHTRFTDDIVRAGINYSFGGSPVVARY